MKEQRRGGHGHQGGSPLTQHIPAAAWLSSLALVVQLVQAGCTDSGVVGTVRGCDPPCAADQVCDLDAGVCALCEEEGCVLCPQGASCEEADECDDCAESDTACIALLCRSCDSSDDCLPDEPICVRNRCVDL